MTLGSLSNYYRDKIGDVDGNDLNGKSFKYKTKIIGKNPERPPQAGNPGDANRTPQPAVPTLNVKVSIPFNYYSNFSRFLELLLTNCEIKLDLSWAKYCLLIEHHNNLTEINFMIASTKRSVPVFTLSINDNIKFLDNIKLI